MRRSFDRFAVPRLVICLAVVTLAAMACGDSSSQLVADHEVDAAPTWDTGVVPGPDTGFGADEAGVDAGPLDAGAEVCQPLSCEELELQCGEVHNGCDSVLHCGECAPFGACGGDGAEGQCAGSPTDLRLNVETALVAGRVTLPGPAPDSVGCSGTSGDVVFSNVETNAEAVAGLRLAVRPEVEEDCAWLFEALMPAGGYDVLLRLGRLEPGSQRLRLEIAQGLVVGPDTDGWVEIEVPVAGVAGEITAGRRLTAAASWDDLDWHVFLSSPTSFADFYGDSTGTGGTFSAVVPEGRYAATVRAQLSAAGLSGLVTQLVELPIEIGDEGEAFAWEFPIGSVSGQVLLNGETPPPAPSCPEAPAELSLLAVGAGQTTPGGTTVLFVDLPCDGGWAFEDVPLPPGAYYVSLNGLSERTRHYASEETVTVVAGEETLIAIEVEERPLVIVGGAVTFDGVPAGAHELCELGVGLRIRSDLADLVLPCEGDGTFETALPVGDYDSVEIFGLGGRFPLGRTLSITEDTDWVTLDVETMTVSGAVTVGGEMAPAGSACGSTTPQIAFADTVTGATRSQDLSIP